MKFTVIPTPEILRNTVECIRLTEHDGAEPLALNVCLNGLPGIVFEHHNGRSPLNQISTRVGRVTDLPTLYIYGQMTEMGVMHYQPQPFTTIQVILKPHALQTLLGLNASMLTNTLVDLCQFAPHDLNLRLMEANTDQARIDLMIAFLVKKLEQARSRDHLIEESLSLIHHNAARVSIQSLLDDLSLSERQFEKRFNQTVGLSPHFYIRVKRFNEAIRLMKARPAVKLTDVAHALHYYDQSHFIREIKTFSGVTPKTLLQKVELQTDQRVYAYV
jgi:AraC-like DNA-binding protein